MSEKAKLSTVLVLLTLGVFTGYYGHKIRNAQRGEAPIADTISVDSIAVDSLVVDTLAVE